MFSLLFYLAGLLLVLIAINVLLVRAIRSEKRRDREAHGRRSPR